MEEALKEQQEAESAATMETKEEMIQAQNEELQKYRERDLKREHRMEKFSVLKELRAIVYSIDYDKIEM